MSVEELEEQLKAEEAGVVIPRPTKEPTPKKERPKHWLLLPPTQWWDAWNANLEPILGPMDQSKEEFIERVQRLFSAPRGVRNVPPAPPSSAFGEVQFFVVA